MCNYKYSSCSRFQYDKQIGEGYLGEKQHGFYYEYPETPTGYRQMYKDWIGGYCDAINVAVSNYHKCPDPSAEKCCKKNMSLHPNFLE